MRSKELLTLYYYYVIFAEVFIFTCCIHSSHSIALLSFYLLIFEFFNLSFKTNQSITVLQQQNRLLTILIIFERISYGLAHHEKSFSDGSFHWKISTINCEYVVRPQVASSEFAETVIRNSDHLEENLKILEKAFLEAFLKKIKNCKNISRFSIPNQIS